ncbi:hypothetical protein COU37_03155 [Candidatus Micrarchaeota archaeon CG10_big_fil_rev_8_21_14_0_10_45_29]|nr:MAG: hypothetical protein COU37_03155 [Candidatus Micrarchaeota archaeon CG10_big_fil_rev_8_21_14_0_10_45_29]QBM01576.1 hypothetical protein [uncultured archaeon]
MKKGMIYTIAIFAMLIALFELAAFSQEQSARQLSLFYAPFGAQTLSWRLEELSLMHVDYMGASKLYFFANSTNISLHLQDTGFPLTDPARGKVYLDSLKSFCEGEWANRTGSSLSLDVSVPNATGKIFTTTSGLNYFHDNAGLSASTGKNSTEAYLIIPSYALIENLTLQIRCNRPSPSLALPLCSTWSAGTTSNYAFINYSEGSTTCAFSDYFDSSLNQQLEARYFAADGNWSHSVHVDWLRSSQKFRIYAEVNATKMDVPDVTCTWNLTLLKTRSSAADEKMYLPIIANLTYQNSSYSGNLTLSRQ